MATELGAALRGTSWQLLHDRMLPDSEHRVAFLAVGPAGVAVLTLVPAGPYLILQPWGVRAGDDELAAGWCRTRAWETKYLLQQLIRRPMRDFRFSGPLFGVGVEAYEPATKVPPGWQPRPPHCIDDYPIRRARAAGQWLRSLPSPLSRIQVHQLADMVNDCCPPAPHR